jgi:hypothetical protein
MLRTRLVIVFVLLVALCSGVARAADFIVTRYDDPPPGACDPGDCSLREAVIAAHFEQDFDRILLSAGRYELTIVGADDASAAGDLDLNRAVEIAGVGAGMTILDANQIEGVIHAREISEVTLRGLTILGGITTNGRAFGVQAQGVSVLIEDCEIRGDEPGTTGNGVTANGVSLTMRRSTIAAAPGSGLNSFNASEVALENVTITGSGNSELFALGGSLAVTNSSFVSVTDAGAEVNLQNATTMTIANSIVVGTCSISASTLTTLGGNLKSPVDAGCGFTGTLDQTVADAGLGALGDNGGTVRTIAPVNGSLAIDASSDPNCLTVDARGVARPQDGDGVGESHCDAGAVEVAPFRPPTPIFHDGFLQGDAEAWSAVAP